jgi:hypothetical protein
MAWDDGQPRNHHNLQLIKTALAQEADVWMLCRQRTKKPPSRITRAMQPKLMFFSSSLRARPVHQYYREEMHQFACIEDGGKA